VRQGLVYAVVSGALIGALAWIDPIFVPLVLLGPLVTGFFFAWRGAGLRWVVGAWAIGGATMIVSDWIVNQEDVLFHVVVTAVMSALAAGAWWVGRALGRQRSRRAEVQAETA
jgi:hypothetical protein